MRIPVRIVRAAVTAAAMGAAGTLSAAPASPEASYTVIIRDRIDGYVLYEDGQSPVYRVPVRLWDIERRRFVYRTETDRQGYFSIPVESSGDYYLVFDWTRVKFRAVEPAGQVVQRAHVVTILPRPVGYVSAPHLMSILGASSMSEIVRRFDERRPRILSP